MRTPTELRQKAIELVEQLPKDMLSEAVEFLEFLYFKANQAKDEKSSNSEEIALLQIIQHRLPSDNQKRLNYLLEQDEIGEITDAENSELLAYAEQIENQNVERLRALIELAKLRNVDLKTLLNEFRLEPKTHNVA